MHEVKKFSRVEKSQNGEVVVEYNDDGRDGETDDDVDVVLQVREAGFRSVPADVG